MNENKKSSFNLEKTLRIFFKGVLEKIARGLLKIGLTANAVTLLGMAGSIAAGVLVALGYPLWAGICLLLAAPLDAIDGTMARLAGIHSKFGAFLDSFTDRYDELFVFAGVLYALITKHHVWGVMVCFAAASGAVMVSYARARAEALGFEAKIGWMTRVERSIVMIVGLLSGKVLVSLGIIAILAHVTAIQRLWAVRRQANSEIKELD